MAVAAWSVAENRERCAPLAFADDAGGDGEPRRAAFGGGWGMAFDRPGLRSAYGVAGTGYLAGDSDAPSKQRERLKAQWPYFRNLPGLPQPAFAGYGLSGAAAYPPDRPDGGGLHSLAYVRTGDQQCTYNVWSMISRAHLEALLEQLRIVPEYRRIGAKD